MARLGVIALRGDGIPIKKGEFMMYSSKRVLLIAGGGTLGNATLLPQQGQRAGKFSGGSHMEVLLLFF